MGTKNKILIENRIDEFCKSSTELLECIQTRCSDPASQGKAKRGRKKKEKSKEK